MEDGSLRWNNYLAAFFAGVVMIHVVPHLLVHHLTFKNLLLGLCSLGIGYLFMRAGKVSFRNKLSLFLFLLGMIAVLAFAFFRFHKG